MHSVDIIVAGLMQIPIMNPPSLHIKILIINYGHVQCITSDLQTNQIIGLVIPWILNYREIFSHEKDEFIWLLKEILLLGDIVFIRTAI